MATFAPRARGTDMPDSAAAELVLDLAADDGAPAAVRRALAGAGLPEPLRQDALLVASELVTNGVRHGAGSPEDRVSVRVVPRAGGVRIEVTDPGPGFTGTVPMPGPRAAGGRGLPIVAALAARWGAGRAPDGAWRVWAELAA
jgi:serine/threonine-protein kinase RsbW